MLNLFRSLWAMNQRRFHDKPIIAVIGTTGVGKSQLAVSIAQGLHSQDGPYRRARILSADSMQLYRGLDVITNKVNHEEMGGIEHWGLDMVSPGQGGSWEVGRWCAEASKQVETLPQDTLPIICGGTHYFIQHFLFPPEEMSTLRPSTPPPETPFNPLDNRWKPSTPRPPVPTDLNEHLTALLDTFWRPDPTWPPLPGGADLDDAPGPSRSRPTIVDEHQLYSIYTLLAAVDPKEAARWHWRDGRKVRRGLERWWERGGGDVGPRENTDNVAVKGRHARLDRRVDRMLENGLLREIAEMRQIALDMYGSDSAIDHTEGIFQAIGYKEFAGLDLAQENPASDSRFPSMLEQTKSRTYQYAKSQVKWIRKQLLPALREARSLGGEVEVYAVPGGEAGEGPARDILHKFLAREVMPSWRDIGHEDAHELLEEVYNPVGETKVPDTAERQELHMRKDCPVCSTPGKPYSLSLSEWDGHLKSRVHRRRVRAKEGAKGKEIAEQIAMRDTIRAEREAKRALLAASRVEDDA